MDAEGRVSTGKFMVGPEGGVVSIRGVVTEAGVVIGGGAIVIGGGVVSSERIQCLSACFWKLITPGAETLPMQKTATIAKSIMFAMDQNLF